MYLLKSAICTTLRLSLYRHKTTRNQRKHPETDVYLFAEFFELLVGHRVVTRRRQLLLPAE